MFPWPIVRLADAIAGILGYQVYVTAIGGPGFHRGRIGADRLHFVRLPPGEPRREALRPKRA